MKKVIIASKKKMGLRCWLDMDGVCSFWEKSLANLCGIDLRTKDVRDRLKKGEKMGTIYKGGVDEMWEIVDRIGGESFWANMELLPWANRLYNMLKKESDYLCFLSSPSNNPVCASGKIKWLQKHRGEKYRDFLIGANKHLCASSNALLVDDSDYKVEKFRKFGGHAFLWPNAFKIIDGDVDLDDTIDKLKAYIKEIKK